MNKIKRVQVGELATLINGDMKKVLRKLDDKSVDCIWTDPPYGHNQNDGDLAHVLEVAMGKTKEIKEGRPILNDGFDEANNLAEFLFKQASRVLKKESAVCCCCCGGGGPDPQFARWSLMMDAHLHFDQMVVWDKVSGGLGWKYRRTYECVLVGHRKGGKMAWYDKSGKVSNVINPKAKFMTETTTESQMISIRKIIPDSEEHPTAKPVELIRGFLALHTKPGDLVVDPFMGGGSTAIAAISMGRRFLGVELDPKFFELSLRRAKEAEKQRVTLAPGVSKDARFGDGKRRRAKVASLLN